MVNNRIDDDSGNQKSHRKSDINPSEDYSSVNLNSFKFKYNQNTFANIKPQQNPDSEFQVFNVQNFNPILHNKFNHEETSSPTNKNNFDGLTKPSVSIFNENTVDVDREQEVDILPIKHYNFNTRCHDQLAKLDECSAKLLTLNHLSSDEHYCSESKKMIDCINAQSSCFKSFEKQVVSWVLKSSRQMVKKNCSPTANRSTRFRRTHSDNSNNSSISSCIESQMKTQMNNCMNKYIVSLEEIAGLERFIPKMSDEDYEIQLACCANDQYKQCVVQSSIQMCSGSKPTTVKNEYSLYNEPSERAKLVLKLKKLEKLRQKVSTKDKLGLVNNLPAQYQEDKYGLSEFRGIHRHSLKFNKIQQDKNQKKVNTEVYSSNEDFRIMRKSNMNQQPRENRLIDKQSVNPDVDEKMIHEMESMIDSMKLTGPELICRSTTRSFCIRRFDGRFAVRDRRATHKSIVPPMLSIYMS